VTGGTGTGTSALTVLPAAGDRRPRPVSLDARVLVNTYVADRYWRLTLHAPQVAQRALPGQFVMLTPQREVEPWPVLPRPMAVYDTDPGRGRVTVLYGVVGDGTRHLSRFAPGETVHTVGPLGRPFDIPDGLRSLCVVGRGIGVCSLTLLARAVARQGGTVTALVSSRSAGSALGVDLLTGLGARVITVRDADGSSAPEDCRARLAESLGDRPPGLVAVCGSRRLVDVAAGLCADWSADLQVSVEARMACGLGYCHGCAGEGGGPDEEAPLVCYDGPVFRWAGAR
jgi:dihydroorotate dehydrogenase electron transfer subunit